MRNSNAIEKAAVEIARRNDEVSRNTAEVARHTEAVAQNTKDINKSHDQVMTAVAVIQGDIGGLKNKVGT